MLRRRGRPPVVTAVGLCRGLAPAELSLPIAIDGKGAQLQLIVSLKVSAVEAMALIKVIALVVAITIIKVVALIKVMAIVEMFAIAKVLVEALAVVQMLAVFKG